MKRLSLLLLASLVLTSAARALIRNSSFEEGLSHWRQTDSKRTTVPQIDSTTAVPSGQSLRLDGATGKYAAVQQTLTLSRALAGRWELTGHLKARGLKNGYSPQITLTAVTPSASDSSRYNYTRLAGFGLQAGRNSLAWQKVGKTFTVPENCRLLVLGLHLYPSKFTKGLPAGDSEGISVWFDSLELKPAEAPPSEKPQAFLTGHMTGSLPGNILEPGEEITMTSHLSNPGSHPLSCSIRWEVKDFFGRTLRIREQKTALAPQAATPVQLTQRLSRPGYYTFRCTAKDSGGRSFSLTGSAVAAVPVPHPSPYFSMGEFYRPASMLPVLRKAGFGSMDVQLCRNQLEPQEGVFKFEGMDRTFAAVRENGMVPIGKFWIYAHHHWSDPKWLTAQKKEFLKKGEFSPEYYKSFERYVRTTVKRYGSQVHGWCMTNEINVTSEKIGDPEYRHYVKAVKIASNVIRELSPGKTITAISTAGVTSFNLAESLLKELKNHIDIIGPDAYTYPYVYGDGQTPITEEAAGLREKLLRYRSYGNPDSRIAVEEKGYSIQKGTPYDHAALKQMAAVMARGMIIVKGIGGTCWSHHLCSVKNAKGNDFGMWLDGMPRPSAAVYATLSRFLSETAGKPLEILPMNGIYAYSFPLAKGGSMTALWSTSDDVSTTLRLPDDAKVHDLMGNSAKFEGKISGMPIFISSAEAPSGLGKRIRQADYSLPAFNVEITYPSLTEVTLHLQNNTGTALKLDISSPRTNKSRTELGPRQKKQWSIPLLKPLRNGETIAFDVSSGTYRLKAEKFIRFSRLPRLDKVKLDGSLDSFRHLAPLELGKGLRLLPGDAANGVWSGTEDLDMKLYLGYDRNYFYMAAEIQDDLSVFDKSGSMLWAQDAFQIVFDALADATVAEKTVKKEDTDLAAGLNKHGEPEIYCFAAPRKEFRGKADYPFFVKKNSQGRYQYELAVPWEKILLKNPEPGTVIGFNMCFFDRDQGSIPRYVMGITPGISGGKCLEQFNKYLLDE